MRSSQNYNGTPADNQKEAERSIQAANGSKTTYHEAVPIQPDPLRGIPSPERYPGVAPEQHQLFSIIGEGIHPLLTTGDQVVTYLCTGQLPDPDSVLIVDLNGQLLLRRLVSVDEVAQTITLTSNGDGVNQLTPLGQVRRVWHVFFKMGNAL